MALSSAYLAETLKKSTETCERKVLFSLLIGSLSVRQYHIYLFVMNHDKPTSMDIQQQFPNSTQSCIDTELMRMRKLGVLKPIPQVGKGVFHYRWEVQDEPIKP